MPQDVSLYNWLDEPLFYDLCDEEYHVIDSTAVFPDNGWIYNSSTKTWTYLIEVDDPEKQYIVCSPLWDTPFEYGEGANVSGPYMIDTLSFDPPTDEYPCADLRPAKAGDSVEFNQRITPPANGSIIKANRLHDFINSLFKTNTIFADTKEEVPFNLYVIPEGANKIGEGEYEFSLEKSKEIKFENIPEGISYEVYQKNKDGNKASVGDMVNDNYKLIEENNIKAVLTDDMVATFLNEKQIINYYGVTYKYDGNLPEDVLATLPTDETKYSNNTEVTAKDPSDTSITIDDKIYEFVSWDEDKKTINNEDIEFVGTWKITEKEKEDEPEEETEQFEITYNLNGGQYNGSKDDIVEKHDKDSWIKIHEAPSREGYKFLYWKGSEYQPNNDYQVVEDHVFTAMREKIPSNTPQHVTPNTGVRKK